MISEEWNIFLSRKIHKCLQLILTVSKDALCFHGNVQALSLPAYVNQEPLLKKGGGGETQRNNFWWLKYYLIGPVLNIFTFPSGEPHETAGIIQSPVCSWLYAYVHYLIYSGSNNMCTREKKGEPKFHIFPVPSPRVQSISICPASLYNRLMYFISQRKRKIYFIQGLFPHAHCN